MKNSAIHAPSISKINSMFRLSYESASTPPTFEKRAFGTSRRATKTEIDVLETDSLFDMCICSMAEMEAMYENHL